MPTGVISGDCLGHGSTCVIMLFCQLRMKLCNLMIMGGTIVYIWGCLALAKAKGHSTAIVLTVVLGGLLPVVVLLALPDKFKHHEKR